MRSVTETSLSIAPQLMSVAIAISHYADHLVLKAFLSKDACGDNRIDHMIWILFQTKKGLMCVKADRMIQ